MAETNKQQSLQFLYLINLIFWSLLALGAAYGTAKSGTGIAAMSVMRPELIMKSIIPVVMAGIIAIYGLVVAVLIANGCKYIWFSIGLVKCQTSNWYIFKRRLRTLFLKTSSIFCNYICLSSRWFVVPMAQKIYDRKVFPIRM